MAKIELFFLKVACFFGWHDWNDENKLDQIFYPNTKKCFWCGKRRNA